MAQDNAVLRHFVTKIVFLGGFDRQGKKTLGSSDREILEQSYWHSNFLLPVVKLSNTSSPFFKLMTAFS